MDRGRAVVGLLVLVLVLAQRSGSFNLDVEQPSVFSGPERSYFGFSVDFFHPADKQSSDVLIGAPRANTSSDGIVERGAVFSCPWRSSTCQKIEFDSSGDRTNEEGAKMEFKSRQWFGASVRSDGEHILACAPLYQWSTFGVSEREPVGTCFLKKGSRVVEYSPCRSVANSPEGQGFCQAGFSVDFLKVGDRTNEEGAKMEFKSRQWFGASVRSDGEHILACAPLYQWSTFGVSEREPVGTCFLKKGSRVVEYSPCRSVANSPEGQGFCQAGFSVDFLKNNRVLVGGPGSFYWQGQLISDSISEIFNRFDGKFITPYGNTQATKSAGANYDDSYLGYSVTVGDFNRDGKEDYVAGVPRGEKALGYVNIFNALNMESMVNFTGTQMAAYFGHSVAASDVNNDGLVDLLVGAPLFMDRGSDGKLREVGQVSVYLGRGGFSFQPPQMLTGSEVYARYGSAIAALADLDMDGYNDVAISAPYGGPQHQGLVYIHNGRAQGPDPTPSQVLQGKWASSYMPASFGYSLSGSTDIDQNGYPDLIVGVFGADKAVLYR
ncbi:Integrin alpha-V [Takifugu flavidus]|uniref:Integrin alpha-V n=1 Tax=Takifugu flavidus TaxID=433684 RepID=A0A5C6PKH1_9TELE|nr:Integrin alpha-V [Takifugu flavidus]